MRQRCHMPLASDENARNQVNMPDPDVKGKENENELTVEELRLLVKNLQEDKSYFELRLEKQIKYNKELELKYEEVHLKSMQASELIKKAESDKSGFQKLSLERKAEIAVLKARIGKLEKENADLSKQLNRLLSERESNHSRLNSPNNDGSHILSRASPNTLTPVLGGVNTRVEPASTNVFEQKTNCHANAADTVENLGINTNEECEVSFATYVVGKRTNAHPVEHNDDLSMADTGAERTNQAATKHDPHVVAPNLSTQATKNIKSKRQGRRKVFMNVNRENNAVEEMVDSARNNQPAKIPTIQSKRRHTELKNDTASSKSTEEEPEVKQAQKRQRRTPAATSTARNRKNSQNEPNRKVPNSPLPEENRQQGTNVKQAKAEDYTKFTIAKLKEQLTICGFSAELQNHRRLPKKAYVELYEKYVLKK